MENSSRWKETEEIYSILLTRGEDLKWRSSLESRNLQHRYLAKGFSLSFQDIEGIRKSMLVQMLNSLVSEGTNFLSCYAFSERLNRDVWVRIGDFDNSVSLYGPCLPAHRGYPWWLRIHDDSDPRELLYSLWRVWRGLTVDHENQYSEARLLDESTHEPTQRARLAVATAPVKEINGIGFIDKYDLSPETPSTIGRLPAVTTPFDTSLFGMPKPGLDNVLTNLENTMPAVRADDVFIEDFETVCDFLNLLRCIFHVRTLQVGPDRASSEFHRLGAWKLLMRPALAEREYLVTQGYIEECSLKLDGFGNMESMMNSDFMAAFWARDEFRLCDSLEIQCNAPLLDWDASEGPLQYDINTRFNIPEESLEGSKILVSSTRPAFLRVLAKMEVGKNIRSQFRLSTGLVDFSQGALPTGKSQSLYHLVALIPQKEDGHWDRIRRFKPGARLFYYCPSSTMSILIYALCDTESMPYLNQRGKPAVPEQKGSSDTIGQSSGPNVFASATPTSGVPPITPNPSVAVPFTPGGVPQPTVKASATPTSSIPPITPNPSVATPYKPGVGGTEGNTKEVVVGVDNNIKLPTTV
ncbi:unnamed protein product [Clonostachys byssicola]|uniref:Uncharacterized protein n=1 Tax=Clonostachys byssicola TaxID=160290 RepID=A0A9N9TXN3_9HYPO|nr:unnamed protein product [Clonostachys byssicola]